MADNRIEILVAARNDAKAAFEQATQQTQAFRAAVAALGPDAGKAGIAVRQMAEGAEKSLATASARAQGLDQALNRLGAGGRLTTLTQQARLAETALSALSPAATRATGPVLGLAAALSGMSASTIAITAVGAAILGVGAAFAVATRSALDFAGHMERLGRLASETDASVNDIQVLQQSLKNLGLSASDADVAMRFLARNISEGNPLLAQLGITSRNSFQAMLQLGDAMGRIEDPADRMRVAFELLGRGGGQMVGVLAGVRAETVRVSAAFDKFGGTITPVDVKKFGDLDRAMDDLAVRVTALQTAFARLSLPFGEAAIEKLTALANAANEVRLAFEAPFGQNALVDLIRLVTGLVHVLLEAKRAVDDFAASFRLAVGDAFGLPRLPREPRGGGGTFELPEDVVKPDFDKEKRQETERERRLKEIQRLLHLNAEAAERFLKTLERVDESSAAAKLTKQFEDAGRAIRAMDDTLHRPLATLDELTKGAGELGDELRALTTPDLELKKIVRFGLPLAPEVEERNRTIRVPDSGPQAGPKQEEFEPHLDSARKALEEFRRFSEEALEIGNRIRDGLAGATQALTTGIAGILEAFLLRTQSVKDAIVGLFRAMVSEILAQIARLLAIKLVAAIASAIFGGPAGVAAGVGIAASAAAGSVGTQAVAPTPSTTGTEVSAQAPAPTTSAARTVPAEAPPAPTAAARPAPAPAAARVAPVAPVAPAARVAPTAQVVPPPPPPVAARATPPPIEAPARPPTPAVPPARATVPPPAPVVPTPAAPVRTPVAAPPPSVRALPPPQVAAQVPAPPPQAPARPAPPPVRPAAPPAPIEAPRPPVVPTLRAVPPPAAVPLRAPAPAPIQSPSAAPRPAPTVPAPPSPVPVAARVATSPVVPPVRPAAPIAPPRAPTVLPAPVVPAAVPSAARVAPPMVPPARPAVQPAPVAPPRPTVGAPPAPVPLAATRATVQPVVAQPVRPLTAPPPVQVVPRAVEPPRLDQLVAVVAAFQRQVAPLRGVMDAVAQSTLRLAATRVPAFAPAPRLDLNLGPIIRGVVASQGGPARRGESDRRPPVHISMHHNVNALSARDYFDSAYGPGGSVRESIRKAMEAAHG